MSSFGSPGWNGSFRKRAMAFIDGENMVHTFQKMKEATDENGLIRTVDAGIAHKIDTFVWRMDALDVRSTQREIIRANYYCSYVGDDEERNNIKREIKTLVFNQAHNSGLPNKLHPLLIKKLQGRAVSKGVDTSLTVDTLKHVYANNVDVVYLFAGDADYVPVCEEISRAGKIIVVCFFSKDLSHALLDLADEYIELDDKFFKWKTA
jgi:uncharacterized LabA/DUF88 family protein